MRWQINLSQAHRNAMTRSDKFGECGFGFPSGVEPIGLVIDIEGPGPRMEKAIACPSAFLKRYAVKYRRGYLVAFGYDDVCARNFRLCISRNEPHAKCTSREG